MTEVHALYVFCKGNHTLVHCLDGLYSFGNNKYDQLGLGHTEHQSTPQKTSFSPNQIISVSCGSYHTLVHCLDGLYSFGNNSEGQLGLGHIRNQLTPQKTSFSSNRISVSCGYYHTFVHCLDGIYSFGNNSFGQLGLGHTKNQSTPQKTSFSSNQIISVSCGYNHTLVHCKYGLYSFGKNLYGQLGLGHTEDHSTPQKISFSSNQIISVSCGYDHTLVQCKDGLYSFGYNRNGQLGLGHTKHQSTPQKTSFSSYQIISVSCGSSHTLVQCKDGLYSFGNNEYGQLGLGHTKHQLTPLKIPYFDIKYTQANSFTNTLFQYRESSDIKIRDENFHKAFISMKCPELLQTKTQTEIETISDCTFKQIMLWIYTNSFESEQPQEIETITEMLAFSLKCGIKSLSQKCSETMKLMIEKNKYHAFDFLLQSQKYSIDLLSKKLIWFIGTNKLFPFPTHFYENFEKNSRAKVIYSILEIISLPLPQSNSFSFLKNNNENLISNLSAFKRLMNDKQHADCVIKINGTKTFHLHSFILSPKWKYFNEEMKNKKELTIDIPTSTFSKVIEYFYFNLGLISEYDACWILFQENKYELSTHEELIEQCMDMTQHIDLNDWKKKIAYALELKKSKKIELIAYFLKENKEIKEKIAELKQQQKQEIKEKISELELKQKQEINELKQQINELSKQQKTSWLF